MLESIALMVVGKDSTEELTIWDIIDIVIYVPYLYVWIRLLAVLLYFALIDLWRSITKWICSKTERLLWAKFVRVVVTLEDWSIRHYPGIGLPDLQTVITLGYGFRLLLCAASICLGAPLTASPLGDYNVSADRRWWAWVEGAWSRIFRAAIRWPPRLD